MYDLDVAYLKGELTKNRLDVAAILNQFRHSKADGVVKGSHKREVLREVWQAFGSFAIPKQVNEALGAGPYVYGHIPPSDDLCDISYLIHCRYVRSFGAY
jgi:hypothetical protein